MAIAMAADHCNAAGGPSHPHASIARKLKAAWTATSIPPPHIAIVAQAPLIETFRGHERPRPWPLLIKFGEHILECGYSHTPSADTRGPCCIHAFRIELPHGQVHLLRVGLGPGSTDTRVHRLQHRVLESEGKRPVQVLLRVPEWHRQGRIGVEDGGGGGGSGGGKVDPPP